MTDQKGGAAVPVSEAQLRAVAKYQAEHYDVIKVKTPKGEKETIKAHADSRGESMNAFILRSVRETIAKDNKSPEE